MTELLVDPEDLAGRMLRPSKTGVTFECPVCRNRFRTDVTGVEPCCTGPNLVRDEHPMTPMVRLVE